MPGPDLQRARQYALQRLENELSPALVYHSVAHTCDDVAPAAERLAALEGVQGEDLVLLLTGAYFHDIGFVLQRLDHESLSRRIARQALPEFGYSPAQAEVVENIIEATRLPQSPHTLLEEIMVDADLDVLGREDFMTGSQALRAELAAFEAPVSDKAWYTLQVNFLSSHSYFTSAARRLRDAQKVLNIETMKRLLAAVADYGD
jgi:uncharacterized protein